MFPRTATAPQSQKITHLSSTVLLLYRPTYLHTKLATMIMRKDNGNDEDDYDDYDDFMIDRY